MADNLRYIPLQVRMTATEKSRIKRAARRADKTVSDWVREKLVAAARREIMAAGLPDPFPDS